MGHDGIGGGQILHSDSLHEHLFEPAHHAEADSAAQDVEITVVCAVVHIRLSWRTCGYAVQGCFGSWAYLQR
jgi:hypothetical protein